MIKATVKITLTLTGPILTQSSSPDTWGIDVVAAKNTKDEYYLSGTLLQGKLRQAWQELQDATKGQTWFKPKMDKWLGKPSEGFLPNTKQLYFSDLVCETATATNALNRIKIDSERGSVAKNQLVIIENPFLVGYDYVFVGQLHFFATHQTEVDDIVHHVEAGLHWTAQLGALRSVGFGRVVVAKCDAPDIASLNPPSTVALDNIGLTITPLYPFCIGNKRLTENLFESVTTISGGVLLGAIVTTWHQLSGQERTQVRENVNEIKDAQRTTLKKHFSLLRISHALPSEELGTRPIVLPLSLVTVAEDETLYDVILLDKPCLINNKTPAFAIDWKSTPKNDFGFPEVKTELRTRTAIDPNTLRAEDKKLFSYEQVVPNDLTWNAQVDLSRIPENDRTQVLSELQSLLSQGLGSIGKTKTPATIAWLSAMKPTLESDCKPLESKQWIITLQTDTLLGSPESLNESSGQKELHAMYKKAWSELSNNKLCLVRYFARQYLPGSYARHQYFNPKANSYKPWLLTEAGSVFLLQAEDEQAGQTAIEDWLTHGLPLSTQTLTYYEIPNDINSQWQHCPFIPQNGYGEIAVNLAIGERLKPNDKRITSISVL
jgi:hypothetical protein